MSPRLGLYLFAFVLFASSAFGQQESARPFGNEFPKLDSLATGEWWKAKPPAQNPPPSMQVPRKEVIAFAIYTCDNDVLKLTGQLFPLMPEEPRTVRLEIQRDGKWEEIAQQDVVYPGWSCHFRVDKWNSTVDTPYRLRHGQEASFEGLIRKNPRDKAEIVVAVMSCNSSRTTGTRPEIIEGLQQHNPDLLFFAGDQTYRHTEHTAGWIEFGLQFRDVLRDRPAVTIPDDHDVGHPNLWGENGKRSVTKANADGGYFYPVDYVNMVQRQQTWHLPDPVDPAPVERNINVYFTRLRIGGIDFAIIEDRKWKSGPEGKIPKMGPRPDHINDPTYDPASIDLPGLELLGSRQLNFLRQWSEDWTEAEMKAVLSQTAFCGAVHMHGGRNDRLLADLDCNGWPQSGRRLALEEIRRGLGVHLCGDQHLAVVVQHGIDEHRDGPFAFTSPALVNTIYGRWWHPLDEKAGPHPIANSPLPWTGDYRDGLGNKISMFAYANPPDISDARQRADGYGIVKFRKDDRSIRMECWPRFSSVSDGDKGQFPGWPITIKQQDNDGRKTLGWLPEIIFPDKTQGVIQVIHEESGEVLYTFRSSTDRFQPHVYAAGQYTVKVGRNRPTQVVLKNFKATDKVQAGSRSVEKLID
jgi:hypothetical protein